MATERQLTANRCNALKSTGPRTEEGKHQSRKNAFRHGLAAETIVPVFENAEDYSDFERELLAQYNPRTALEHHLVARLASLFWRLRRAAAIESGLFNIQAKALKESAVSARPGSSHVYITDDQALPNGRSRPFQPDNSKLAVAFLRIENFNETMLEKLGYYEARLWRCTMQTLNAIDTYRRQTNG